MTSFLSQLTLSVMLVNLLLLTDCQTKSGKRRQRRSTRNGAEGPNMCKVLQVYGRQDKYFTHCVADHLKMICERPTYERWECCPGFAKKSRELGCTIEKPLDNIIGTARELKLNKFIALAEKARLTTDLMQYGPYTAFVPSDEAIADAAPALVSSLSDTKGGSPLIRYHIAPGRLNISNFKERDQELVTLHDGSRVRVNKYAYGVATVNCARITRPDELATNGIVHVIDKVITPLDVHGTVSERLAADERFSQFNLAMLVSDMSKKLKTKKGSFTVLAPTDQAFAKLPVDLLNRILTDADTAEKVLQRHVVRGVFCADAIVVSVGLKTLDDTRLLFRCKRDGLLVNEAKVLYPDIVGSNGVIHGIDKVLLPDVVKTAEDLMKEMSLNDFLTLVDMAGLNETLQGSNYTIFTPTDKAIKDLPRGYLSALPKEDLQTLIKYHMVPGKITNDNIVGEHQLDTLSPLAVKIKIMISRKGVTVDKATVDEETRECQDAIIHKIDQVLVPNQNSLVNEISKDTELSEFLDMLHQSGVTEMLLPSGSYTVLAPTNKAFSMLDKKLLQKIIEDPVRLKKFVGRHIISSLILKCNIPEHGIYSTRSMQTDPTDFEFHQRSRRLHVNKHAVAVSNDILTSNGVLYKIDHVLPCTCEPSLRTNQGIYISDHRYRRRF